MGASSSRSAEAIPSSDKIAFTASSFTAGAAISLPMARPSPS